MYYEAIQQFARSLRALDHVLGKAEEYAKARGFNVDNFLEARLAPDMVPFVRQVRIACDHAKNAAAALSGKELPKHDDDEKTFAELRARIGKCLGVLEGLKAEDFAAVKPETIIKLPLRAGQAMKAHDYLWHRQLPNFYFHVVTSYDLLRAGGVDVGKSDFLGKLDIIAV
jgi:hypothetical protein